MARTAQPNYKGDKYRGIYTSEQFAKIVKEHNLSDKMKTRGKAVMVNNETPIAVAKRENVSHQAIYRTLERIAKMVERSGWTRVFYDVPADKVDELNALYTDFLAKHDLVGE